MAASGVMLAQCNRNEPEPASPPAAAPEPTPPKVIATPTAMSREELLDAVSRAASAYAAGEATQGSDSLVGRPFAIRIPFGCNGPQPTPAAATGDGLARWTWGPEQKTIQLTLTPGDWLNTALIAGAADGSDWEAVEGFWIPRPWLRKEACSSIRADALQSGEVTPSPQTVGLAAVFRADESRVGRRNGRAYAYTVRPDGDSPLAAPAGGYRAVLEGRLAAFPGGRAIRCRASGPDQRPVCVAAIQLDRVAFQTADGETLSEWRPG
ncbi:hypothetical protein [Brevundimonas basaltis]|uniref:Uncharacterized protein n=1 Tax=Brevundimonas basaltis TaxID=472166 RepID=A0A7W8HXD3_9CAUL|nr:hypothetical protein [Brevundimonas basaltis]MBB5291679.1 hypothetical protein [Brevundimonas basaltis]